MFISHEKIALMVTLFTLVGLCFGFMLGAWNGKD